MCSFKLFQQQTGILHVFMGLLPCVTMAAYSEMIQFFKYSAENGQYVSSKIEFELCWEFTVGVEECATSVFRVVVGSSLRQWMAPECK